MEQVFELTIEPEEAAGIVRFELRDGGGAHLASHAARLSGSAYWDGLFDARGFVELYEGSIQLTDHPATAAELLERLGVFLGQEVLGPEVTAALWKPIAQRRLLVRAPSGASRLAAALAGVPWEIARPAAGAEPLVERNLSLRVVPPGAETAGAGAIDTAEPEEGALKVLLVFAEAPGSRPLAMRQEREALVDLFADQVMPGRQLQVDVLCHGVTRRRLREAIQENGGYHLIHWSGHGHDDLLELYREDGAPDRLSGEGLYDLIQQAGGFVPQMVVLSACLSGTLTRIGSLVELEAALARRPGEAPAPESRASASPAPAEPLAPHAPLAPAARAALDLSARSGYAGTALGLLAAGVPQVLAMRYAVGDPYARELACRVYRHLLADAARHPADTALALARSDLLDPKRADAAAFGAVDHATPVLFGAARLRMAPHKGRSEWLERRRPFPQPLLQGDSRELDRPRDLVGRGAELTRLAIDWLDGEGPAVALVAGLGGLGKTALAAEAIHLWHRRFAMTLAFQAKPEPLTADAFCQKLDAKLVLHSQVYVARSEAHPGARVYLPVTGGLTGEARYQQMRDNLLEALRDEAILLVLDNFESNLEPVRGENGYRAADPEWNRLLAHLARHLPETGSRLLVTSRHRPSALAPAGLAVSIPLGPLPMNEAVLYLQQVPALAALAYGDRPGRTLAYRLLTVSRGHPLILSRLGALAGDRKALENALDALESKGLSQALPDIFAKAASPEDRERERAYLEDIAAGSIDLLLERASPDARRLLWIASLANESLSEALIAGVWSGRNVEPEQEGSPPPPGPLLAELTGAGLLTVGGQAAARIYEIHELVRERAAEWMARRPEEKAGRAEGEVRVAFGERYVALFRGHLTSGQPAARDRAAEAGRRALAYFVPARAFDRLGAFASTLVNSTADPGVLAAIIGELQAVIEEVPAGEDRWSVRTYVADALSRAGRPDLALPAYESAVAEAEAAEAWSDLGWIAHNWANALVNIGKLGEAQLAYRQSAEAKRKAGSARIYIVMSELETARIEILEGQSATALREIEPRLDALRGWWRRYLAGAEVPEAPNSEVLGSALVSALNVAGSAHTMLEHWQNCLSLLVEMEDVQRQRGEGAHSLARTRFNRYDPLLRLGRLNEAQEVLQGCAAVYHQVGDTTRHARALSALAELWDERGDHSQASGLERQALALRNQLPMPEDRGISHNNLGNFLKALGETGDAARHTLAAVAYFLASGHAQRRNNWERNLRVNLSRAHAAGATYELPRLADLLARPDFEPLRRFLAERGVETAELQREIDEVVERVRSGLSSPEDS